MKKYIISAVAVIVVLGAAAAVYYKSQGMGSVKSTGQAVAELLGQKYNKSADAVIINVQTDTGAFAKGTVNYKDEAGGGVWFAAKTDKGWELVTDGNGIAPCEPVNRYNIPKDMLPQCLDTQHNNNLITR